ncbi:MAG: SpoIIE family protein phosphatase [Bacteroidales bacterium]|nr:SpoIIE family protein phosphatase [Bacteroidales bacterium]
MKIKDYFNNIAVRQGARVGLLLIIVAAITLEATGLIQYYFSQKGLKEEASLRAESQLEATRNKILDVINQAEAAVRNNQLIAEYCLASTPDSLANIPALIVKNNPVVTGSTLALVPGYDKSRPLYAPYSFQGPDGTIKNTSLATEEYDYQHQEWFVKPLELGTGYWSEPYVDEGGGEVLMTTYSLPVQGKDGQIAAILTADLSLDWLTDLVGNVKVYPNAFSMLVSRSGQFMVCPAETLVMKKSIQEVAATMGDTATFNGLSRSMLSGESGNMQVRYEGATSYVYFAPVERTGWSMSIVIPDKEIFGNIRRIGGLVTLLQLLGLLMLVLIIRATIKNMLKFQSLDERKKKMENELQIASGIQMSMIPKIFPPFPERKDIDMDAAIVPAKEVGGDLYDFYIRDEKLCFCIGDVSGKGVPASLVMAVTRSLFRTASAHENSPQRIVSSMNDSMAEMNESNMFVTFFCGILDLTNGHLRYCNAGHNAPFIFTDHIGRLPVNANLPLGVMPGIPFAEQETDLKYDDALFLYTDGLTEAENENHELFSEERAEAVLQSRRSAHDQLEAMKEAVAQFVGNAPQSDDLTLLFIHYLNDAMPDKSERHLMLRNDIQQIPQLAEFIEAIAEEKSLDQSLAMGLNLALEEAVTNVIMYAYPKGSDGLVDIEAIIRKDSLEFIISDSGKPFDPTLAPEADVKLGVQDRPIGGLGIYLVKKLMDNVSYKRENGKNILSMTKKI